MLVYNLVNSVAIGIKKVEMKLKLVLRDIELEK